MKPSTSAINMYESISNKSTTLERSEGILLTKLRERGKMFQKGEEIQNEFRKQSYTFGGEREIEERREEKHRERERLV